MGCGMRCWSWLRDCSRWCGGVFGGVMAMMVMVAEEDVFVPFTNHTPMSQSRSFTGHYALSFSC